MGGTTCAFTGHRPYKFPWKSNEDDPRCLALKKILTEQIAVLAETGVTDFFSGMAEGADCYCSQIILTLREKNPALKLHCVLPHEGQTDKWSDSARERYNMILKQADSVEYVTLSGGLPVLPIRLKEIPLLTEKASRYGTLFRINPERPIWGIPETWHVTAIRDGKQI